MKGASVQAYGMLIGPRQTTMNRRLTRTALGRCGVRRSAVTGRSSSSSSNGYVNGPSRLSISYKTLSDSHGTK